MIYKVKLTKLAEKQLRKVPKFIGLKLAQWVQAVNIQGLEEVRRIPGYHDEPLKGERKGERSIRLNRAYRAIYTVQEDQSIEFVCVEEVNKHDY